jgi:hypothetical protein
LGLHRQWWRICQARHHLLLLSLRPIRTSWGTV